MSDLSKSDAPNEELAREATPSRPTPKARVAIGKADARYWMQPGKLLTDPRSRFLRCKIQVAGRRESFPLRTSNKATAAAKAAQIFGDVVALGWDAALAKYNPQTAAKPERTATVGELLTEVTATAGYRASTLTTYSQCLRQITAEIAGIEDQPFFF